MSDSEEELGYIKKSNRGNINSNDNDESLDFELGSAATRDDDDDDVSIKRIRKRKIIQDVNSSIDKSKDIEDDPFYTPTKSSNKILDESDDEQLNEKKIIDSSSSDDEEEQEVDKEENKIIDSSSSDEEEEEEEEKQNKIVKNNNNDNSANRRNIDNSESDQIKKKRKLNNNNKIKESNNVNENEDNNDSVGGDGEIHSEAEEEGVKIKRKPKSKVVNLKTSKRRQKTFTENDLRYDYGLDKLYKQWKSANLNSNKPVKENLKKLLDVFDRWAKDLSPGLSLVDAIYTAEKYGKLSTTNSIIASIENGIWHPLKQEADAKNDIQLQRIVDDETTKDDDNNNNNNDKFKSNVNKIPNINNNNNNNNNIVSSIPQLAKKIVTPLPLPKAPLKLLPLFRPPTQNLSK